jgi:hypothetical protein
VTRECPGPSAFASRLPRPVAAFSTVPSGFGVTSPGCEVHRNAQGSIPIRRSVCAAVRPSADRGVRNLNPCGDGRCLRPRGLWQGRASVRRADGRFVELGHFRLADGKDKPSDTLTSRPSYRIAASLADRLAENTTPLVHFPLLRRSAGQGCVVEMGERAIRGQTA